MRVQHGPTPLSGFRAWAATAVLALVATMGLVAIPTAAQATPPVSPVNDAAGIAVTSSGDSVLAGGTGRITVTASNPDGADHLYNATAVVVLPVGVTYEPGSATPGGLNGIGEPTVLPWIPDPNDPDPENPRSAWVLVWENLADLPLGSSVQVSFEVRADNDDYPVGSTFALGAGVYAHSDERVVPAVSVPVSGPPVISDATEGGATDSSVTVTALQLSKAQNSDEEAYRGPLTPVEYTLTVRTAPQAGTGTDDVVVVDRVPAWFQVTSCSDDCVQEIVTDDVTGEVFTQLTWTLGDLGNDELIDLTYSAFVGLNKITAPDGVADGEAIRPVEGGYTVPNTAVATGAYSGSVANEDDAVISVSADTSVLVVDLGVVKSNSGGLFRAGETKTFTLTVRTSQYMSASGIQLVDTIPNGMCPVLPALPAGIDLPGDWPDECPAPGSVPGVVLTGATVAGLTVADGVVTVTFDLADIDPSGESVVTYDVYMREFYQGGSRTSVGDAFTNQVELTGTTTPAADNEVDDDDAQVENGSSSSVLTEAVTLSKRVWENTDRVKITGVDSGTGLTCADGVYTDPDAASSPAAQLGDLVCFRIEATFPAGVSTRDVQVGDFVPVGSSIVGWAARTGLGWASVAAAGADPALQTASRWIVGDAQDGVSYVQPGQALQLDVLMRIDTVPLEQPRITGNLAKMRYTSGDGSIVALRDDVDVRVAPAPPLTLDKQVDGQPALNPVQEGQELVFTIDVAHARTDGGLNDYPLDTIQVWDVLPAGFGCADILHVSVAPAFTSCEPQDDGSTLIVWDLDFTDEPLQGGDTAPIEYTLVVPSPLSIGSSHTNTAAVTRFTSVSTNGIDVDASGATFHPTNPVGAYLGTPNAAEAADDATVALGNAAVTKAVVNTGVVESNNDQLTQATIGETVTWEYSATIPAKTSIFNGTLVDSLPLGRLVTTDPAVAFSSTAAAGAYVFGPGCERDPLEFRLCGDPTHAGFGALLFPVSWTNDADSPVSFTVNLTAPVADAAANVHGAAITNTAVLTSTTTTQPGALPVQRSTALASVAVVEPLPSLAKNVATSADGPWSESNLGVVGGQTVYYRLYATNQDGRPPLHDAVVVDCLDETLIVGALPTGVTASGECAPGIQQLTWTLPGPLVAGTPQSVVYPVTLPDDAVAGVLYPNTATLTGSTLAGDEPNERAVTERTDTANILVDRPAITKTADRVSPNNIYVPGETVTWTITATIPADITLRNAAITDQLPTVFPADAGTLVGTPSCSSSDAALCAGATTLTASDRTFGVLLGDVLPAQTQRTVTLTFAIVIPPTVTNAQDNNVTYTNQAVLRWDHAAGPPPTSASGTWDDGVGSANSPIVVRRPAVTVGKSVSAPAVPKAQGEIFTYTVTASATGGNNNRTAYDVVVVDSLPEDVIPVAADGTDLVDEDTVAGGGVWDAANRTLTWTIGALSPGSAQSFSYDARLAPAADLSGAALVNTVTPQSWSSLASGGKTYGPGPAVTASVTPAFPRIDAVKTQVVPGPVYIDEDVAFSFTLTNNGTAAALSLDAVDTLPDGWSYVPGSARLGGAVLDDPEIDGRDLTWTGLGPLARTESLTITYDAVADDSVAVGNGVPHTNSVTAAEVTDATGGTSYDGGTGSYVGTAGTATATIHQADLQIVKTPGAFTAGGTGTFTLVVTNNGGDPAVGLTVRDQLDLPAGVTLSGVTAPGGSCGIPDDDDLLECTRADLAVGGTWTINVTVAIAADVVEGTTVSNTASVGARTEDRTPGNNTSTATGTVITLADLAVVKTVTTPASGPVVAGEDIAWSITLTNDGPSVSRASAGAPIVLVDTLPTNVSGISLTGGTAADDCQIAAGALTCTITADIGVGDALTVALSGTVNSDVEAAAAAIANTVRIDEYTTTDPDEENNSSTVTTGVDVREFLTIDKDIVDPAPPAEVAPGEAITYRLAVANGGPSVARGVYVVDTLPADVTFDQITVGGTAWTAAPGAGNTVRFDLDGVLAAETFAPTLEYTVTVDPAFTGANTDLANTASVSSIWRADQDEDSATPGVVEPQADLRLTKSVRPTGGVSGDPVVAGETAIYTLTTDNLGPSDADAVTLVDTLPAGLGIVALPADCTADGQEITCVKADGLDVTEAAWVVEITVRVAASFTDASLINDAHVSSTTSDPVPANNDADVELEVIPLAQLTVTKTPSQAVVRAGEDVTWTIVVGNDGPSDAQNVTLTDALDADLVLVSATFPDGACTGTAFLTCVLGTIPADGEIVVTVVTTVRSSVADGTVIPNTATATSTTHDPDTDEPATAGDSDEIAVEAVSDLTIVKSTTTPTITAGGIALFQLAVGNEGPSDAAASVVVTDTLPAGLTYVSASTTGGPAVWQCAAAGQVVTCDLRDGDTDAPVTLAAGTSAPTLVIAASVAASQPAGAVTNSAAVTSPSDPTPPSDTEDVTVVTFADLGIVKSNVGTPTAGETFSWTIELTNHGLSDSVATASDPIVITDVLPEGVSYVSAAGAGAACDVAVAGGVETVTCEIASTLAPDDTVTITLTVDVAEDVSGALSNTATVAPGATPEPADPVWPNASTVTTPPVIEEADLEIVKTVVTDAADIVAGQPITWELTVTNRGPSNSDATAAAPIVVSDVLPEGVTLDTVTGPTGDWTCTPAADGASFACALTADLATGDPQVITVTGTIDPSAQGDIVNTATVAPGTTPQPDDSEDNDTSTTTSPVRESADLQLSKGISAQIVAGATGRYMLQVYNAGPSTAREVTITDSLPDELTFVRAVGDDAALWTCDDTDLREVVCAYDGTVLPGTWLTLEIEVSADADLSGTVENAAVVDSSTPDPQPENNDDTVTGTFVTVADLSVVKSHDAAALAVAGEEFTWTITVTNNGPSDSVASAAEPILVTDDLAAGTTLVAAGTSPQCETDAGDAQRVVCEITATIPAGESVALEVRVAIDEALSGSLSNTAVVIPSATVDPEPGNNESTDTVTITEVADLTVAKQVDTTTPIAGEQIQWTITVTNAGPSDSDASPENPIVVTDSLPAGVSFVSATGAGWTCDAAVVPDGAPERVTCELVADLAVGDAEPITVIGLIAPDVQGTIANRATVAPGETPQPDDNPLPDTTTVDAVITESADLLLAKRNGIPVVAGATGTYLLTVTNDGPSTARGVWLEDTLPAGLSFARIVPPATGASPWTCAPSDGDAQLVECALAGLLAPGASLELELEVTADASLTGDVVNAATTGATTPDPDPENNDATVTTTVRTAADLGIVKTHTGAAVAGEAFAWTVTVTNRGPSDSVASVAEPIVVRDVLPAGVTLSETTTSGSDAFACAQDGLEGDRQVVLCAITATIPVDGVVVLTLHVDLAEDLSGDIANSATVAPGATPEPADPAEPNSSTDIVTITEVADLAIAKEVVTDESEIVAGGEVVWTVTVTNLGPSNSDATADDPITVIDTLPAGVGYVSASGDGWVCEPTDAASDGRERVECVRAEDLPVGAAPDITVTGAIAPDVQGDIVNTVEVTPGLTEQPEGGEPDRDTTTSPVRESADLALTKVVSQDIVAGATGRYLFSVTNLGPSTARDVAIRDTLPDGLTFAGIATGETASPWNCAADADDASLVVCALVDPLAPGDTVELEIVVDAAATLQGDIVNSAVVSSTTPDPEPENNPATAVGTLVESADVSIVKSVVGDARVGEELVYELVVANAGPGDARGVVVEDVLPDALVPVGVESGEGWSCVIDGQRVVCLLPQLAAGATAPVISLTVQVLAGAYPEVSNTVTVHTATPEDEDALEDNTSTATVDVPPLSELSITKELHGELVTGQVATYTVTVVNEGPTEDPGPITVVDELPEGLTARSWSVDGNGVCETTERVFTCVLPGLAVGAEATLTFVVGVADTARGTLVNTATVTSDADPTTGAASAEGEVRVTELPVAGGVMGAYLPFGVALLALGVLALWWSRRREPGELQERR